MKLVFDLGMYDASDTEYYLESGHRVVAVEANPALADAARRRLSSYVESGQLKIVNAAISTDDKPVELTLSAEDLGSSSVFQEKVATRAPLATFKVPGITTAALIEQFGIPYYLKVDIEGADRLAVLALTPKTRPEYVSFEIGDDFEPLLDHLCAIGCSQFRAINQYNLRDLFSENSLAEYWSLKMLSAFGFREPQLVRRSGRFFKLGHSSGPGPWVSGGAWRSRDDLMRRWRQPKQSDHRNVWYDLHAR